MKLNKIEIKNFKNIKNKTFTLTDLNEFYGDNATGKTAVLDAIKFCLVGDKKDVDKISTSATEAEVKLTIDINKTPIDIKTTINKSGKVSCALNVNSIKSDNPRTFIRKHVNSINFNPLLMLDKKDRFKRLLSLIPLKLKKEDIIIPDTDKTFPIANPLLINYDLHGVEVLTSVDKDLRGARHSIYKERLLLQKVLEDATNTYDESKSAYLSKYDEEVNHKLDYEKAVEDIAKHKALNAVGIEHTEELEKKITQVTSDKVVLESCISNGRALRKEAEQTIEFNKKKIEELAVILINDNKKLLKANEELDLLNHKKETQKKVLEDYTVGLSKLDKEKCKATDVSSINSLMKTVVLKTEDFNKIHKTWDLYNNLIQKKFQQFQQAVLRPITKAVPKLKIDGEKITYKDVSIDELSTSELLSLSLKFIALNDKENNLLLIDKLETLDENSISKLDIDKFVIVASRVGKDKIKEIKGSEWNSIKMSND